MIPSIHSARVVIRCATKLVKIILPVSLAMPVLANTALEATFTDSIDNGWDQVERWRDTNSAYLQEGFPPDGRGDQTDQRATFIADATPVVCEMLILCGNRILLQSITVCFPTITLQLSNFFISVFI